MGGPIGIAANPASGKDVRRLVARASVFDNQEKCAIVSRCLAGIVSVGSPEIYYLPDTHDITKSALEHAHISATAVDSPRTGSALDTTRAATALQNAGCAVVITLGGDGTNRAFARGWRDAPLVPISTGTNNVFPTLIEATVAGAAAGLVATGQVSFPDVAQQSKCITIEIENEPDDLALIDAVVTTDRFVGSRALLDSKHLITAVLTRADPAAVGVTAIGGLLHPIAVQDNAGLVIEFAQGLQPGVQPGQGYLRAPIAPGLYQDVAIADTRQISVGDSIEVRGPCTLAFDGERERVLKAGQMAKMTLKRDGPWVVDVQRALQAAAVSGRFRRQPGEQHAY